MRMTTKALMLVLLLAPFSQGALGRVYMCVDPETGATSFTDKACAESSPGEEVRVNTTNYESGRRTASTSRGPKVWNSHRDSRKTGREYNDERRRMYQEKASAAVSGG